MEYKIFILLLVFSCKLFCIIEAKIQKFCASNQRRARFCTMQYAPVCAYYSCDHPPCISTRGNACMACSDPEVLYYTPGSCEGSSLSNSLLKQQNYCLEAERKAEVCQEIYLPVCGWLYERAQCGEARCKIQFGNRCEACRNPNVEMITQDTCN